jgi:protease-4
MYNLLRPMTPAEVAYMQLTIEDVYKRFTSIVAEGRDMSVEQVDNLGQGRVWTGAEAVEIGLADEIGTLEDALTYAALSIEGVSSLDDIQIAEYPKPLTALESLLESLEGTTPSVFEGIALENIETGKPYARLPYEIIVR